MLEQKIQILSYGVGIWDAETLGNHRVVIRVDETNTPAVRVIIPWRHRDQHPEKKRLILVDHSSDSRITNLVCHLINREKVDLIFQSLSGTGDYYLYFMPYTGSVQAPYPQIEYKDPDNPPSSEWFKTYQHLDDAVCPQLHQAQAVEIQSIDDLSSFYPMKSLPPNGN